MQLLRQNQHLMQLLVRRQLMQQPMSWTMEMHYPRSSTSDHFWIFDSGCFNHMSPYPAGFITKQPSPHPTVRTADLTPKHVLFSGNYSTDLIQLPEVLHVPGLAIGLVSLTQLQEMGLLISFDFFGCAIQDPKTKQILGKGRRVTSLPMKFPAYLVNLVNTMLYLLNSMTIHPYLPLTLSIPMSGDRHHIHLWVDTGTSLSSLMITQRFTWIYLMKHRSELPQLYINFARMIQTQFSKPIKILRADNAMEYKESSLIAFLRSQGTISQYSCPGTSPQNGRAERKHRHILDTVRTLLVSAKCPERFWGEAAFTAVYTINRHPTPVLQHKSPYEVLHGVLPTYELLKVWGCACFVQLQPHEYTKLEPRGRLCLFLGYGIEHKGYRCWDPISKRLRISRHVTFWEDVPFYDMPNSEPGITHHTPFFTDPSLSLDTPFTTPIPTPVSDSTATTSDPSPPVPTPSTPPESPAESTDPGPSTSTAVRRSDRVRQVPAHLRDYHCYATLLSHHEPTSYKEASSSSHWQAAMQEELRALAKAQTWDSVPLPPGKRAIGSKWVFKIKTKSDGSIDRYKARLVAKGFNQEYGIDYEETFAPVARVTSVRSLLAIAATKNWPLFQMDVKNAFLNGDLSEEVYMTPPPGVSLPSGHVCRLRKALYGLKQAPRAWFEKFSNTVLSLGFSASNYDSGLFTRTTAAGSILLLLYVDDMIITGSDSTGIASLKQSLSSAFEMKDLGKLHYFLGLEVLSDVSGTYLCQAKYISDLLSKAGLSDTKVASTPLEYNLHLTPSAGTPLQDPTRYRQLVGSLVYLTVTRPDIAYAVHTVSQFMAAPRSDHYAAVLRILRYLKGTMFHGLYFSSTSSLVLRGFSDADWDSDMTDRRSTTGYCFFLGDSLISWRSKKQSLTARSSTEAEYRALADTSQELIWLRWLLSDMGAPQKSPTPLWCDNNSAIQIAHNDVFHERTKHIEIDCHFVRQHVVRNTIRLHPISTLDQPADIFTKAHLPGRFRELSPVHAQIPPVARDVDRHTWERESGGVPFQCPSLTLTNYTTWSIRMEAILDAQGLWESIQPPTGVAVEEKKDKSAKAFIFQALPEDIVLQARIHTLKSEFEALRMKDGETIDEFTGKLSGMVSKYNSLGATLEDGVLVRKLLDSVPDKFLQLVASIEQYSDVDTMPFEEAIGRLKAYEDRLRLRGLPVQVLLQVEEDVDRVIEEEAEVVAVEAVVECGAPKKRDDEANLTQAQEDEVALLLTVCGEQTETLVLLNEEKVFPGEANYKSQSGSNVWYLDNGESNHMIGIRSLFADLDTNITGQVRFGDGSRVSIAGKGTILLECKNGEQQVVSEVYYIPALHSNILSLGQLTEIGYKVEMVDEYLRLRDEVGRLVMKVQRSKNRYKIALQTTQPVCLLANLDDEAWVWHARLGHVNFRVIEWMVQKDLVRGVPSIKHPEQVCEGCMVAKRTRRSFPKESLWRASRPVELIHVDLCGPITPSTVAEGIKRQLTAPYSPQQNGVAERRNRSILETTRSLLKTMQGMTPYEAMNGSKPTLHHLKVFGCVGYVKKPINHTTKLSNRSVSMVYLWVEPGSKAYRMFNPKENKAVVARNVVFDKKKEWDWALVQQGESTMKEPWIGGYVNQGLKEQVQEENSASDEDENKGADEKVQEESESSSGKPAIATEPVSTILQPELDYPVELEPDELMLIGDEPTTYEEAAGEHFWREAMKVEIGSIEKNQTWQLTTLPYGAFGAKGYVQRQGVDFEDAFAPVARIETIRLLLAMAAMKGWTMHHVDVKSAFLNGELREQVYVTQPDGFVVKGKEHMVYRLHKALYGLRQAPRAWNTRLDRELKELGFLKCPQEQAVYRFNNSKIILLVGVYVDDLIVTGSSEEQVARFKEKMKQLFEMSDLGHLTYYLGIEVRQTETGIELKQAGYAKKMLQSAGMLDCNSTKTPMEPKFSLSKDADGVPVNASDYRCLVGCLRYLIHTRPDLAYSVGVVSRYMNTPKESHLKAVKQILRYVKGTLQLGLIYERGGDGKLIGFSDSSHNMDRDDGKGTTGTVFYFSNNPISWSSQKQRTVALSSCEAEFMAATACQAVWLKNLLKDLTGWESSSVKLYIDNKSAIALMKNPVFHGRSKDIDTKYHFIRECVERKLITVEHVSGEEQLADILTKALHRVKFAEMRSLLAMKTMTN
ncbi:hypothetical protein OSB04_012278 [Centaurea solstitialis]|uniref:Integrase catalytic domain-containing protein n=1 Tax=Centaurea solstitialis TaxID=347529 RepID=A0AA38TCS8_9ASTR|nr:hypothetical protein OSB04_012278 [Centaurea solstitialis]